MLRAEAWGSMLPTLLFFFLFLSEFQAEKEKEKVRERGRENEKRESIYTSRPLSESRKLTWWGSVEHVTQMHSDGRLMFACTASKTRTQTSLKSVDREEMIQVQNTRWIYFKFLILLFDPRELDTMLRWSESCVARLRCRYCRSSPSLRHLIVPPIHSDIYIQAQRTRASRNESLALLLLLLSVFVLHTGDACHHFR